MDILKLIFKIFVQIVLKIFFRDVEAFNADEVPAQGPVIFVCAPHANQFLDPLVAMSRVTRKVGFLAAAKSMDRPVVGALIKAMDSIPVVRPQDLAKNVSGKIKSQGTKIIGEGTKFQTEFKVGDSLFANDQTLSVTAIASDTELTVKQGFSKDLDALTKFKWVPQVDQQKVYEVVWETLRNGECIGIFPEGGSHDRTEMLPMKAGFTIMALGAMDKYKDMPPVKIVPVGLNYFKGHRFRSEAYAHFGAPIEVKRELVEMYSKGGKDKRDACAQLMELVHDALLGLTVNVPDYQTLQLLVLARKLYKPKKVQLDASQKLKLTRRFAEGYKKMKDHPEIKAYLERVTQYYSSLRQHGLRDYQVQQMTLGGERAKVLFAWRALLAVCLTLLALPGLLLNIPIGLIARKLSKAKAEEAKAGSTVKIAGRDVMATWKVLFAAFLIPLFYLIYTVLITRIYGPTIESGILRFFFPFFVFFTLPVFSYGSVLFFERSLLLFRSLKSLLLTLKPGYNDGLELRATRDKLQEDIIAIVEKFGPQTIENFDKERVVSPEAINREREMKLASPPMSPVAAASPAVAASPAPESPAPQESKKDK